MLSAVKHSKPAIVKRRVKELKRSSDQAATIAVVGSMIKERRSVWSVKQLQGLVKEQYDRSVSACTVLDILKNKFQLSYRKIKRVPFAGNSERSKVLRSLYAQKMLTVYQSGKRVINVDESWIPHADFRQRRWKRRGMANSAQDKTLSQKINIITAMSSDGEVWIALTTCNTDSDVLMLFMTRLASALTKQAADWRSSTVFLLDGVSYGWFQLK